MSDVYTTFSPATKDLATGLGADTRRLLSIVSTGFATSIKAADVEQLTLQIEAAAKMIRKHARAR